MRSRRPGVMAPPPSFIWTRRIVLTLLTLFALIPVYVMVSSSLKPLQDVTGTFRCDNVRTPSFSIACARWCSAVRGLIPRVAAIALFDWPSARRLMISFSRAVSAL